MINAASNHTLGLLAYSVPRPCWGSDSGKHVTGVQWIVDCNAVPREGDHVVVYDRATKEAFLFGVVVTKRPKRARELRVRCLGEEGHVFRVRWKDERPHSSVAVAKQVLHCF